MDAWAPIVERPMVKRGLHVFFHGVHVFASSQLHGQ